MTNDLVQFLRARLDDDEQAAKDADPGLSNVLSQVEYLYKEAEADERHIARHDPARVLREVEAKRQIVELHGRLDDGAPFCVTCDTPSGVPGPLHGCPTLRLLALPYSDHPDYRSEWAPDQA